MAEEASYDSRVVDAEVKAGRRGVEFIPFFFCPLRRFACGDYFPIEDFCKRQRSMGGVELSVSLV